MFPKRSIHRICGKGRCLFSKATLRFEVRPRSDRKAAYVLQPIKPLFSYWIDLRYVYFFVPNRTNIIDRKRLTQTLFHSNQKVLEECVLVAVHWINLIKMRLMFPSVRKMATRRTQWVVLVPELRGIELLVDPVKARSKLRDTEISTKYMY